MLIQLLLPAALEGLGRPREVDLHEVINTILYINRSGCQWNMLPHDFPPIAGIQIVQHTAAVPEPSSIGLLFSAVSILGLWYRKRR